MHKFRTCLFYLGIFLLLFGVRLVVVHNFGSSTPFFDDWDMGVFIHKFFEGTLTATDWITPAYQHQMLFSKMINLGLFDLNQEQWDTLNILVFNSVLWCIAPLFLIWIARRNNHLLSATAVTIFCLLLWLLPISIVSATWAIVTHFYCMILLLLLAYWGMSQTAKSLPWKVGAVAMALSALTIGAGVFTAVPLMVVVAYRFLFVKESRADSKITLFTLGAILLFALSTTFLWGLAESSNAFYQAKSMSVFLETLGTTLFWPLRENLYLGMLLLAPTIVLTFMVLRNAIELTPFTIFTLALSAYMIMQSLGISYARNDANGINPAVRYNEFLLLSLIANFFALLIIVGHSRVAEAFKSGLLIAWVLTLYSAIPAQLDVAKQVATEELSRRENQTNTARSYIGVSDPKVLYGQSYFHIAFPRSPERLAGWLDKYKALKTLPAELQVPPRLRVNPGEVFARNAAVQPNLDVIEARYKGESTVGSFNRSMGAQNAIGQYESQALLAERDYLMIPTLGFLGMDGLSLELIELATGKSTPIRPLGDATNAEVWRANYVPAPQGRYTIRATDESNLLWFAFAAPRELGPVSYYVRRLIENRHWVWNIGLIFLLLTVSGGVVRHLADRRPLL